MRKNPFRILPAAGVALAALLAGGAGAQPAPTDTPSCPIDAALAAQAPAAAAAPAPAKPVVDTTGCLVSVQALPKGVRLYDLRARGDYVEFHVPGAQHARLAELGAMPRTDGGDFVAYDDGRFRADALATCERLRGYGLAKARVLDGGIAAWAHAHDRARVLQLNRLGDGELAAMVADPATRAVVLADALRPALAARPDSPAAARAVRTVLLADDTTPAATLSAKLAAAPATFYWVGTPQRLQALLAAQVALERKREAGPAERSACSAL